MSKARVFEWHKRFRKGQIDLEDEERSGRLSTSKTIENIQKIKQIVRENRSLNIGLIATIVSIDKETIRQI